jgi:hypothetical protein
VGLASSGQLLAGCLRHWTDLHEASLKMVRGEVPSVAALPSLSLAGGRPGESVGLSDLISRILRVGEKGQRSVAKGLLDLNSWMLP